MITGAAVATVDPAECCCSRGTSWHAATWRPYCNRLKCSHAGCFGERLFETGVPILGSHRTSGTNHYFPAEALRVLTSQ